MKRKMKNTLGMFAAILGAAAAGAAIGMLLAPKKGEELRRDIKTTAEDWSKKAGNLLAEGKEKAKNSAYEFKSEANSH